MATAAVLLAAAGACSGGDTETGPSTPSTPSTTAVVATAAPTTTVAPAPARAPDGPLAEVCPTTIVVQTDSLPHPRHGSLYSLVTTSPSIDASRQAVTGPLRRVTGEMEDVGIEIRSGGPSVAFRAPVDLQADAAGADPIHLAEVAFSRLVDAGVDAVGVVALGPGSDDMIMWDPVTRPGVASAADLADDGVEVRHLVGERYIDYLVAVGVLDPSVLTERGGPELAGFIAADGAIARQGDAVIDPALLPAIAQWGREIGFELGSVSGWNDVDRLLASDGSLSDDCLGRLVPVIQSAIGAYAADPGPVNELLSELRTAFDPLDRVGAPVLDDAVQRAITDGRWNDEFRGVAGAIDVDRLSGFADELTDTLDLEVRPIDDLVTTSFLVTEPD